MLDKQAGLRLLAGASLVPAFLWAYWPTLEKLVTAWREEPDYSHGFLVVPVALWMLWVRRDRFPGMAGKLAFAGLVLVPLSVVMRLLSARYYLEPVDGWSILVWVAGVVWLFGGWRVLRWSLPSIGFLLFMIPLPFRVDQWLRLPLQQAATQLSCWILRILGQAAWAEGNVIDMGGRPVAVEGACGGLRIFMGVIALAYAYVVLVRRPWWQKALILVSAVPAAVLANCARIVTLAMLSDAARKTAHDPTGWAMVPLAALLLGLVVWYSGKLVQEVEVVDIGELTRRSTA